MNFEIIEGVLNINLNFIMILVFVVLLLIMGYLINKRFIIFNKYCIFVLVVGGFIFMFLIWLGYISGIFKFNFENIF